jgi:glycosyltransferase involved in cell wall biosynthesis
VITNTDARAFDVIEITNEMPLNRIGGVGSVIENLLSGFQAVGIKALWFLVDHSYRPFEIEEILVECPSVAIGTHEDLRHFQAPIAHLHSYNYNPQLLTYLHDKKAIFTIHSLLVYEERSNDVELPLAVEWQEALIAACDEVVLISEAERKYYRKLGYHRLNPRVSVVHNGVRPPARFCNRRRNRVLGFCGRLVPRKHPEYVQMILREKGFEGYSTMIAGKAFSTYARDLLRDLDIEGRVCYLGWCGGARLEAFYDSIDVLAVPSIYEPFGMAALEAAARGIPVVCTRVDGLVEVLGEYAFYCEGDTYADFRTAMYRWLAAGEDTIAALTEGARARYQQHFTDVVMAREYQRRFASLMGQQMVNG